MAWEGAQTCIPGVTAAADLSANQYQFVKESATGMVVNTTNGGRCDGVLQNAPGAAGEAAAVAIGGVTKVKAGASFARGAALMSDAVGKAVTAASVATSATKTASAETYNLDPGQTVIVDVDNVGGATATWDAASASITDTTTYPVTDQDTKTMTVTITGGEYSGVVQTVTFSGATTTAAAVAAGINAQARGLQASVVGGQVKLTTDGAGSGFDIATGAGTGDLTWGSSTAGTGDVVDINAVTAAEFETVMEADTTALVAVTAGVPTITSPTTGITSELDFTGGTALAAFGLSVEVITGSASDSHIRGTALEAAGGADELVTMTLAPTSKF
jgi:hypothetical protein